MISLLTSSIMQQEAAPFPVETLVSFEANIKGKRATITSPTKSHWCHFQICLRYIIEYTRVLTGFIWHNRSRNIKDEYIANVVDLMLIDIHLRDVYPKMWLKRRYIGDGIPCALTYPRVAFWKGGDISIDSNACSLDLYWSYWLVYGSYGELIVSFWEWWK
jgi:hypothetical protein